MSGESFEDINELLRLLRKLQRASPNAWECLECGRVCDLKADDYCPTCGRELPDDG